MSLRILHFADSAPEPNSGAAGTDYQGVMALRRAGHHVDAVWTDQLSHRIKHYNLRYLLELPQSYAKVMREYLRRGEYDVVQVSQPHGYLAAKHLARSGRRTVFVHRSHGFEPRVWRDLARWHRRYPEPRSPHRRLASDLMQRLLERNNRLIARYADGHLVSATECADYLMRAYGVSGGHVAAIPQGITEDYLTGGCPVTGSRLTRMLYVGQFAFIKAPMILGGVVSKLLSGRSDLEFTWVCSSEHHQQALNQIAPHVRDRVKLLDWMSQAQLKEVYDQHGVFLFPSFFEGFGKVFLEAMSRGLIVVAADNGGMRDIIDHGVNGFKVLTGDVAEMTGQVEAILHDKAAAQTISQRAMGTARTLTWDKYVEACTDFYFRLMHWKSRKA